jgi:hypothetical protein
MPDPGFGIFQGEPPEPATGVAEATKSQPAEGTAKPVRTPRLAPSRPLPPSRLSVAKQLEILRAHVVASKAGVQASTNHDLARIVNLHVNNVSGANPFFVSIGLIHRGGGGFLPSDAAVEYNNACDWEPEKAPLKLLPAIQESWFASVVSQLLTLRDRPETEVLAALAGASDAPGDAKDSLKMLLEYMQLTQLITIEGVTVRPGPNLSVGRRVPPAASGEPVPAPPVIPPTPTAEKPAADAAPTRVGNSSGGGQGIRFTIDLNVTMEEMAGWSPDRVAAFMAGLAQVITARGSTQAK